jgi:oxalate decarboxylase
MSRHAYEVDSSPARVERDGGSRVDVTADQLPLLSGMALATLALEAGAVREPHWHPNAAELSFCLEGSARMTIVEPGGQRVSMAVAAGDLAFVPRGFIHDIENTGAGTTRFVVCFSHERYEDLNLSTSLTQMPERVLRSTFGADRGAFDWVEPLSEPAFIAPSGAAAEPGPEHPASPYRYQLERLEPELANAGGSLILGRADDFPILDGLAMYSLRMSGSAVREPHWHPNAAELNYVIEGSVRLTIVSPGGDVETVDLEAGEISYIPRGYFHHIETRGADAAHLAVFFDHEMPSDNGISAALSAYPDPVLSAVFGQPAGTFAAIPDFDADVLLGPGAED